MFGLSPIPLYAIAFLLFTNLVTVFAWQWNRSAAQAEREKVAVCQAKFDSFKSQVEALGKQQERKVAELIATAAAVTKDTEKRYEESLAALRADYDRLRKHYVGASSSPVPTTGGGTREFDAAAKDAVSDPVRLAAECAETTLNLIWLQEHERTQQRITNDRNNPP